MNGKTAFLGLMLAASCVAQTAYAAGKVPLVPRTAAMQCADRKIELKADCFKQEGIAGLSCTRQRLSIIDAGTGRELGSHTFQPAPLQKGDAYPLISEHLGDVSCKETPAKEKFIVIMMSNGGNCEQCEWQQLYTWDGKVLGSSIDAKKDPVISAALKGAENKKSKTLGAGDLSLSSAATNVLASEPYSPYGLRCVAGTKTYDADTTRIADSLKSRYERAWGKDWMGKPVPRQRIDPQLMGEIAAISGCAAIIDEPACANFFSPEIGGEFYMFAEFGSKVPLRKQFDEAVTALPPSEGKAAVQRCMKLVAKK